MKHLLLLLALLCLAQRSAAQGGKIYRSLDDYRNDRYETVPDLYLKPPVDEAVFGRFGYKLACTDRETKKTLKATTFAVVGDTLYVNLAYLCDTTRENSLQCLPAERIDRYVLFRYFSSYQAAMVGYNWAMFGLVGAAVTYDREREKVPYFILDLQTGKVEQITCEVMTRIIGGYPDLLKSYLSLQEPESRATIDDYLNLYRYRKLRGEPELPIPGAADRNGRPYGRLDSLHDRFFGHLCDGRRLSVQARRDRSGHSLRTVRKSAYARRAEPFALARTGDRGLRPDRQTEKQNVTHRTERLALCQLSPLSGPRARAMLRDSVSATGYSAG